MITSGLVVDGVAHSLPAHLQPYNHQAVAAAVHNHRMSYVEPSAYLKSVVPPPSSQQQQQQQQQQSSEPPQPAATPEFLRPLPKPAPVNPLKTSRAPSKYSADCRPVNLTAPKEPPPPLQVEQQHLQLLQDDGRHHPYSVYAHSRLYVTAPPYHPYPMHQPPAPYGVYTSPYAPVIPRDARHHLMHQPQERRYSSPPSKNGAGAVGIGGGCGPSPSSSPPEPFKVPNGRDNKQSHQLQQQQQQQQQQLQHHHHLQQQQQQRILPPLPPPLVPTTTAVLQSVVLNNNNNNNNNINNNIVAEPPLKKSRRVSVTPESSPPPPPPPKTSNFTKGSLIRLANGNLKKVEDMRTEDFLNSVEDSDLHKIDPSTVVRIAPVTDTAKGNIKITLSYGDQRSRLMVVDGKKNGSAAAGAASKSQQVEMESGAEHPYFVFGRGWASWDPAKTLVKYGLTCQRLQVGDVCVSLSKRTTAAAVADSRAATPPLPPPPPSSSSSSHGKRRQQQHGQQHSALHVAAHQQQQHQQQQQHLLHHQQQQQQQQQHHHVMMHHSAVHKAQQLQLLRAEDDKNGRNKRRWSAPDPEAAI